MIIHEWDDIPPHQAAIPWKSAFQRGKHLGRTFAARINTALDEYDWLFSTRGISPAARESVVEGTTEIISGWGPDLMDEITGIAEGSHRTLDDIVTLNCRTEILGTIRNQDPGECSTMLLVPEDGSAPRTLQTWDWIESLSKDALMRRFTVDSGMEVTTFAEFGQLAKIGVNSSGLGVHFNILYHDEDGSNPGIPVHLMARKILDSAQTITEAEAIVRSAPVAASSVITVSTLPREPGEVAEAACLEISPAGVAVLAARPGVPLLHTNHFLDAGLAQGERSGNLQSSRDRYTCLEERASAVSALDPRSRAERLGEDQPVVCVRPDHRQPIDMQWVSKATFCLDLEQRTIEYCTGSPAAASPGSWTVFPRT